jgi:hypothetical protein
VIIMQTQIAIQFRAQLEVLRTVLFSLSLDLADVPWREGGWTRKQILGHLLDSAANNRQRFVRAFIDGSYAGPKYAQDEWVVAHSYASQPWETLLRWWLVEHEILIAIVDNIPAERLESVCAVGDNPPVTLRFLIEDYIAHQLHHLGQLTAGEMAA